ncbi:MAG: sulfatase [Myxococcales bacterium]|nr:sulfatase [Myxococcales bacterium]
MSPATQGWFAAHARVGLLLGLVVAFPLQLLLALGVGGAELDRGGRWHYAVLAVLAAAAPLLLSLALATLTALPQASALGRRLAILFDAALLSAWSVFHAGATAVRLLAGDYPSVAAYQMLLASPVQLLSEALDGYALVMALLLGGATVVFALSARGLAQGGMPRQLAALGKLWLLPAPLLLAASVAALWLPARTLRQGTAETSLVSALLDDDLLHPTQRDANTAAAAGGADSGLLRSAGARWSRLARHAGGPRPNFLLIVLESVPFDHLGYAGYGREVSPHIDALAAAGMRMERVWSVATQSNYAQMAILSSLHPRRRQHLDVYERLDYPRVLPHDVFQPLGYATATISSQTEAWQGMRRFQDTGTPTLFHDATDHPGPHIGSGLERKLPDHLTTDRVLSWLDSVTGQPFALYVNFQRTHFPYALPEGQDAPYQPADPDEDSFGFLSYPEALRETAVNRYDNALRYVDAQIGRITAALRQRRQLDNTLIVVTADHGELFHEHGHVTHGKSLHEREVRVPLLLHWPKRIAPGASTLGVSTLDIMPTVLELLGLPPHPAHQGASFAKLSRGGRRGRALYMTLQGLRYADAILCWPYKLVHESSHARFLLYDLERDPEEAHNLIGEQRAVGRLLGQRLLSQVKAQLGYHADPTLTAARFAPTLARCPKLP